MFYVLITDLPDTSLIANETRSTFRAERDIWRFSNRVVGYYTLNVFAETGALLGIEMVQGGTQRTTLIHRSDCECTQATFKHYAYRSPVYQIFLRNLAVGDFIVRILSSPELQAALGPTRVRIQILPFIPSTLKFIYCLIQDCSACINGKCVSNDTCVCYREYSGSACGTLALDSTRLQLNISNSISLRNTTTSYYLYVSSNDIGNDANLFLEIKPPTATIQVHFDKV